MMQRLSLLLRPLPLLVCALLVLPAAADDKVGWMGVLLGGSSTPEYSRDSANGPGVLVTGIVEGSPAADSGLRAQDRVLTVNGVRVASVPKLIDQVSSAGPGTWVELTVDRGGRERELRMRLVERPDRDTDIAMRRGWVGVQAIELTESLREHFGAPAEAGVMISDIEESSPADIAGFELGDVVFLVGESEIKSAVQLSRRITRGGVGNKTEFTVARDGVEIVLEAMIELEPEKDPEESGRTPALRRR